MTSLNGERNGKMLVHYRTRKRAMLPCIRFNLLLSLGCLGPLHCPHYQEPAYKFGMVVRTYFVEVVSQSKASSARLHNAGDLLTEGVKAN